MRLLRSSALPFQPICGAAVDARWRVAALNVAIEERVGLLTNWLSQRHSRKSTTWGREAESGHQRPLGADGKSRPAAAQPSKRGSGRCDPGDAGDDAPLLPAERANAAKGRGGRTA
jgi:hypothetical protein